MISPFTEQHVKERGERETDNGGDGDNGDNGYDGGVATGVAT